MECKRCGRSNLMSSDFSTDNSRKSGLQPYCRSCKNEQAREAYKRNGNKNVWREKNKERCLELSREYNKRRRLENQSDLVKRKVKNKELIKTGYKICSSCKITKPTSSFYFFKNAYTCDCIECRKKSRKRCYDKTYKKKRIKPLSKATKKFHNCVSTNVRWTLKHGKGRSKWEDLVGYSRTDLMKHLESLFEDGMSWDNHGQWHIDHIVPVSAFNFETAHDIDFKRCWDLSNLQPLWAEDNLKKSDSLGKPFQPSFNISI